MATLDVWDQPSGYSFGLVEEQASISLPLPVKLQNISGVTFKVISGSLPGGLRIDGVNIVGSPYIISNVVDYNFCIRASKDGVISDRTYKITVNGATDPVFITPPLDLPMGIHQQLYALDASYVSYQLEAYDLNPSTNRLTYYIASGDGLLPPGLTLSSTGLISGYIKPLSQVNTLNVSYQFTVTLTNGVNYAQRIFRIVVIGDDQFRADSLVLDGFAGLFTADSTYIRNPVWVSTSTLGLFRANNYLTLPVTVYDNTDTVFRLERTNMEVYAIAKRLVLSDNKLGLNTVTITTNNTVPVGGQYFTLENYITGADSTTYRIYSVIDLGESRYKLTLYSPLLVDIPDNSYFYIGTLSQLPEGTAFDTTTGEVYGTIPYQPAITKTYIFTVTAIRYGDSKDDYVTTSKTFNVIVIGEITSKIAWTTDTNLGNIPASYVSTLRVNATSTVTDTAVLYSLTGGSLPGGLSLSTDGEIVGTVNRYYNPLTGTLGITTFSEYSGSNLNEGSVTYSDITFDNGTTTIDRTYKFKVTANDQFNYSANEREFTVGITTPNTVEYSNITARPFLNPTQRNVWKNFINDTTIFTPSSIYRTNDPSFGVQSNLSMLIYAGLQTEEAAAYVGAIGLNHKRKRFTFGNVKKAIATDPITGATVYEVIYVEINDPLEPNGKRLPAAIKSPNGKLAAPTADNNANIWQSGAIDVDTQYTNQPNLSVTIDSTGYIVSDTSANTYYSNSISNWQDRLRATVDANGDAILTERNYLPLWMRTIQPDSKEELGYALAVPLCFCKTGEADTIMLNIKFSGFDFKVLDYTIDRYTIDSVAGETGDKYLVFRNDRITV